jgi:parvulin-like peptidyl-prolyl isomerase
MRISRGPWLAAAALTLSCLPASAQTPPPPSAAPAGVAALVNGQPITEAALHRLLDHVKPEKQAEARPDLLDELIDRLLLDQYLQQMNVVVDRAEVDKQIEKLRADLKKDNQTLEANLQKIGWTEADLREQIQSALRWQKHAATLAADKAVREFFDANKEMFDGSMVHARHILLTPATSDARAGEEAAARLLAVKKEIEGKVAAGLAKLPPNTDKLKAEQERMRLVDEEFAAAARAHSVCPSREHGGDLPEFPRAGHMVEPFAKAAFALQPYQMSDPVKTQFGYHLILSLEKRSGADVKFEQVKDGVKDVYIDRIREGVIAQVRAKSKIVVYPAPAAAPPAPRS